MGITFQRVGPTDVGLNHRQRCETCHEEAELLVVSPSSHKGECYKCNPREFLALWGEAEEIIDDVVEIIEKEEHGA